MGLFFWRPHWKALMSAIKQPRLLAPSAVPRSEFDEFLYASIVEEHNGTWLSVLSALARSNVDPWEEAARLASLPRDAARQSLTTLIAGTPDGPLARKNPEALVERLISLLPRCTAARGPSPTGEPQRLVALPNATATPRAITLYIAAVIFLLLVNQWLEGHLAPQSNPPGAASVTPAAIFTQPAPAKSPLPAGPPGG